MAFQEAFGSVKTALPSFTAKSARSTGVTLFGLSTVLTAFKSLLKSDFQIFSDGVPPNARNSMLTSSGSFNERFTAKTVTCRVASSYIRAAVNVLMPFRCSLS